MIGELYSYSKKVVQPFKSGWPSQQSKSPKLGGRGGALVTRLEDRHTGVMNFGDPGPWVPIFVIILGTLP